MPTPSAERIRKAVDAHLAARDIPDTLTLADGLEEALMGFADHPVDGLIAVYDAFKCIEIIAARDGTSYEDAEDDFFYNTVGTFVGPKTPMFYWPLQRKRGSEWQPVWRENI